MTSAGTAHQIAHHFLLKAIATECHLTCLLLDAAARAQNTTPFMLLLGEVTRGRM